MGIGFLYMRLDYRRHLFLMLINLLLGIGIAIVSILGMSIGVILQNKPLKGSCGGTDASGECAICGKANTEC